MQLEYTGFEQKTLLDNKSVIARIYDGKEPPDSSFNGVTIVLDASEKSLLQWKQDIKLAEELQQKGFWILWELQLDLSSESFEDDVRFMTLQLNVRHFVDTILSKFRESSFGVCLYRGKIVEGMSDYLKLLAALLPDELFCFLCLDTSDLVDPARYFRMLPLESLSHLKLFLKGPCAEAYPYAIPAWGWDHEKSPLGYCGKQTFPSFPQKRIADAICLHDAVEDKELNQVIQYLGSNPFRVIPEARLTEEWDGIERLIIFSESLDERGWRKVRGFEAAGGKVINFPSDAAWLLPQQTSLPSSLDALL